MDALTLLHERNACAKLVAPGPDDAAVDQIIAAAIKANDHRRLRPWRFLVLREDALIRLGAAFAEAMQQDNPETDEEALASIAEKPLRAPVVIVSILSPKTDEKVPHIEQVLSAGAATQMLNLACEALGFGCIWRTGAMAFHPHIAAHLALSPDESIVGFTYIGTRVNQKPLVEMHPQDFYRVL